MTVHLTMSLRIFKDMLVLRKLSEKSLPPSFESKNTANDKGLWAHEKNEGLNFTERAAAECTFRSLPVSLSGTVLRKICNQLAPGMRPMEPYDSNVMRVFNLTSTTFVDELSDSSHQNLYNNFKFAQVWFSNGTMLPLPLCVCVCVCVGTEMIHLTNTDRWISGGISGKSIKNSIFTKHVLNPIDAHEGQ